MTGMDLLTSLTAVFCHEPYAFFIQALHQLVVSVLRQLNSQVMQGNSRG